MTARILDRLESTAYAVGLSVLGYHLAAAIVREWVGKAIDRALTWAEPL